ncbi:MAG: molybdopterin-dependent oxidoreductase [Longimicrobiales bacterium]
MSDTLPMSDGLKRRDFLKVLGVSGAGASIAGCSTGDVERLIPYVVPPEEITPGVATWYASVCQECSARCGIRVKTREGRAIMIEGNPDHPVSQGGVCSRGVSALQSLYNPDRVQTPLRRQADGTLLAVTWDDAMAAFVSEVGSRRPLFITGSTGPTEDALINEFVSRVDGHRVVYDALYDSALREATRVAFGVDGLPNYDLAAAELIVSFGADFLETWNSPVALSHQYAESHSVDHGEKGRFVFLGSRLSLTGQNADEWIPIPVGAEAPVALGMAAHLVRAGADAGPYADLLSSFSVEEGAQAAGIDPAVLSQLATDMAGRSSVALGPGLAGNHENAAAANLAVLILNVVAGSVGETVRIAEAPAAGSTGHGYGALMEGMRDLANGTYGSVVVWGTNPAYSTPPEAGFAQAFETAGFKVAFATSLDETSSLADLVMPASHALESWSDSIPAPGVYAVGQPAMRQVPKFDSRPVADVLLAAGEQMGHGYGTTSFRDYLAGANRAWLATNGGAAGLTGDPDVHWRELLRTGSVSYPPLEAEAGSLVSSTTALSFDAPTLAGSGDFNLVVYPSSRFGDGTQSNRPWLQELPDPVSKMVWHSWIEMHPNAAEAMGLETGSVLRITSEQGEIEAPVWLYPGIREDTVAIAMGGGHTAYGQFADGNGVNPMALLPAVSDPASGALALASTRVSLTPTGEWRRVATTEGSNSQDNRNVAPAIALSALGHAEVEDEGAHHEPLRELQEMGGFKPVETEGQSADYPLPGTEYGEYAEPQARWAMSIDLDKCTGCSACVTACQAENNVPWVGENQILMGRDMHWMRIERYYESVDASHAGTVDVRFLPMLCQHCNNAPCEPVCPVFAAYHTPDGLNGQAYNRCVGTRYCANNCPYKVRVFNWYSYTDAIPEEMTWQFNPDVTVRENGVMEKCSFCVQRIREVGNRAAVEGRGVRDGEVRPACQNSCPTHAITFGNVKDPDSAVAALVADERNYRVLDALINTQPAVNYMKKVTHHEVDGGDH